MTKPPLSLLHWPKGRYVNASSTDLAKTFARVRKELRAKADAEARDRAEAEAKTIRVQQIFANRRRGT
jgi:hypothetical protein